MEGCCCSASLNGPLGWGLAEVWSGVMAGKELLPLLLACASCPAYSNVGRPPLARLQHRPEVLGREFGLRSIHRPALLGKWSCVSTQVYCSEALLLLCQCLTAVCLQVLWEETNGDAIITTGVGQHQMWAAQWYKYTEPRRCAPLCCMWPCSGGPVCRSPQLCLLRHVAPDCSDLAAHGPDCCSPALAGGHRLAASGPWASACQLPLAQLLRGTAQTRGGQRRCVCPAAGVWLSASLGLTSPLTTDSLDSA